MRTEFKLCAAILLVFVASVQNISPASARYVGYVGRQHYYAHRPVTMHDYFADHPKVRAATIGAGVGTAAGAVTGLVSGRGILRGSVIGAGTGAGVGLIRSSHTMRRHPIFRDVATGSAVGLGLGMAGGRSHGHWGMKGAGVGGAIGLAAGLLGHGL